MLQVIERLHDHINQAPTRYELYRVWTIVGTLKSGTRLIYSKRHFFIDEGSWTIANVGQCDNCGYGRSAPTSPRRTGAADGAGGLPRPAEHHRSLALPDRGRSDAAGEAYRGKGLSHWSYCPELLRVSTSP
ncbi:DUF1329 domain-containing protein [Pseudomonas sp. A6]|uniref:DUF1329 domain-containing protein n=1 Tax=Pseudomonas sp. A6 TaxID=410021 RepID=UPI004025B17D